MACAALVQIGPARQSFWALHMRDEAPLRERTRMLPRRRELQITHGSHRDGEPAQLRVRDRGVELDARSSRNSPASRRAARTAPRQVWTRKQAGVAARGTLALDGGAVREIEALAVIDDTAGHHARQTEWHWSAGVGESADGVALAWNLVSGVNDPRTAQSARSGSRARPARRRPSASRATSRRSTARTARSCASRPRPSAAAARTC